MIINRFAFFDFKRNIFKMSKTPENIVWDSAKLNVVNAGRQTA